MKQGVQDHQWGWNKELSLLVPPALCCPHPCWDPCSSPGPCLCVTSSTPYSCYLRGTRISLPLTLHTLCFSTTILSRNRLWRLPVFQGLGGVREKRCAAAGQ